MSREIKFRAWDEENKLMIYSDKQPYGYEWEINKHHGVICFSFDYVDNDFGGNVYYGEHLPIMQYTECKDDNDTEIYEGDILKFNQYGDDRDYIARVEFGNPNGEYNWGWQLVFKEPFHLNNSILLWVEMAGVGCEVIGNIYENPELIKGKK